MEKMTGKNDEKLLAPQDVEAVLQDFIKDKMISERVATKIIKKIREKNVSLNKEELVKLVKTIQHSSKKATGKKKKSTSKPKSRVDTKEKQPGNQDLFDKQLKQTIDSNAEFIKELNNELASIEHKIEHIEENQKQMIETRPYADNDAENTHEPYPKFQPKNEHVSESDFVLNEDMQPLCEIRNTAENVVLLMRWLQYLVDKLGQNNLSDVLDYYVNIDWITEDVRLDLIKYAKGITFQEQQETKDTQQAFTIDDHLQSFMFIQKLKGTKFQEDFLIKLNSKIDKMGKTIQRHLV